VPPKDLSAEAPENNPVNRRLADAMVARNGPESGTGALIINADDWGRDHETTSRISDCVLRGSVSSVSAMVFMEDSERAAGIAVERQVDAGLHLNLSEPFSVAGAAPRLLEHHRRVATYLRGWSRFAQVLYHPGLEGSFEYVVAAQLDEFERLYGEAPTRIDGHHHMHLCANVLFRGLLPGGTIVRRNFSFLPGEKTLANRMYRRSVDYVLARKHRVVDLFFSLPPLEPASRLQRIFSLARHLTVEVETHPINPKEYRYLTEGAMFCQTQGPLVAKGFQSSRLVSSEKR
jgi:chitin disaccharide deacetylase